MNRKRNTQKLCEIRRLGATEYVENMYSKEFLLEDFWIPSDRVCTHTGVPIKTLISPQFRAARDVNNENKNWFTNARCASE